MRRVLAIAKLNLLELFRDRGELVGVIILPLLLTWVFGTAFGSQGAERPLEIPIADQDGTAYSKAIVTIIADAPSYEMASATAEEARDAVRSGDAPVAVIIPKGFGAAIEASKTATVETVSDPSSDRAQAALEVVKGAAVRVSANVVSARAANETLSDPAGLEQYSSAAPQSSENSEEQVRHGLGRFRSAPLEPVEMTFAEAYRTADSFWEPVPPVELDAQFVQATAAREAEMEAPANTQYSVGFTVFFVFMVAMGSAGGVLEERELGTLRRLLAAPARRAEILGGKVLGVAAVAAFEAALLVGFGALVFGVKWGQDPLAVAVLLLALVVAATGLGIMLSALVRTRAQMSALSPVLSTALAMLGGCYWPIEVTSPTMQTVAKFTPTGWAMVGLKDVVARGMGLDAVVLPVAILFAFGVAAVGIGVARLRLE